MTGRLNDVVSKVAVRYFEVDQQGVVYHMWYLAYFEDARNDFLERRGLPLRDLVSSGHDLQLVHTELDWSRGVRWSKDATVSIRVRPKRVGTTSFTLEFAVLDDKGAAVRGTTVYVVIDREGKKQAVPPRLRRILETGSAAGRPCQ